MISKDLVAASTKPFILSILSEGESYGYEIIQKVKTLTDKQLHWTDGMLYPVLHRLENDGFIKSKWKVAESGRKRKYYVLLKSGKSQLLEEQKQWSVINSALMTLWHSPQLSNGQHL